MLVTLGAAFAVAFAQTTPPAFFTSPNCTPVPPFVTNVDQAISFAIANQSQTLYVEGVAQSAGTSLAPGSQLEIRPGRQGFAGCVLLPAGDATIVKASTATGPIFDLDGAALTLTEMHVDGALVPTVGNGGIARMTGSSTLQLVDSRMELGHAQDSGGCVHNTGGAVTMSGTSVVNACRADVDGGNLYVANGSLSVTDTYDGHAGRDGGNVFAIDATVELTGINELGIADRNGGGIFGTGPLFSLVMLPGSVLRNHTALADGGALYMAKGSATLGTIRTSYANHGGGVYVSEGDASLQGVVEECGAISGSGGAAYVTGLGNLDVQGDLSDNWATQHGGAIFADDRAEVGLVDTIIHDNVARANG
ncbi:MAG: hypothetical protein AAF602_16880, partial [Myxococcota bacterium]